MDRCAGHLLATLSAMEVPRYVRLLAAAHSWAWSWATNNGWTADVGLSAVPAYAAMKVLDWVVATALSWHMP